MSKHPFVRRSKMSLSCSAEFIVAEALMPYAFSPRYPALFCGICDAMSLPGVSLSRHGKQRLCCATSASNRSGRSGNLEIGQDIKDKESGASCCFACVVTYCRVCLIVAHRPRVLHLPFAMPLQSPAAPSAAQDTVKLSGLNFAL